MVDATYLNNAHALTGNGEVYFEGIAEKRSDIQSFSTAFSIGSKIVCSDDWSLWMLVRVSGDKVWTETSGITVSVSLH